MSRSPRPPVPALDVDALLNDPATRIIVCCGAGGVGKTTTAAALGLRAAEAGRQTVVLTIDPARRLAQSMGLRELDNIPREVSDINRSAGGRLDAMMLDMKRTFDEIVLAHSVPERAEQIFANPFYQSVSSSFAGTQEYMAMEKLGQLRAQADEHGRWDLIVVDTPPSRSALDFLDAPKRLGSFLDGRFIRVLMAPARASGRAYLKAVGAGVGAMTSVLTKVLGAQVLRDVQGFVAALDTMFGGFRERAEETYALLQAPGTAFLVVATPERDALREASYFVERLQADGMPVAGLVLNRVHRSGAATLSAERAQAGAEDLEEALAAAASRSEVGELDNPQKSRVGVPDRSRPDGASGTIGYGERALAAALLRLHAERALTMGREHRLLGRFTAAHPRVPVVEVAARPGDVHDLDGLRDIGSDLGDLGRLREPAS